MSKPFDIPDELRHLYERPVCLVTGGTSGVGLATARRFATEGFNLYICGRSPERLEQAAEQIKAAADGPMICLTGQNDLTVPGEAERLAAAVIESYARIDLLVNNAAMAPLAAIDEMTDGLIDETLNINVRSVYLLTRAVWRQMKQQTSGAIINISSLAALDPFPGFSLYGATKAWIDTLTRALANEGREYGIRSYSVRPGAVETPMLRGLFPDFPADQTVSPEAVAEKIWKCYSDQQAHQSGQAYNVTNQPVDS